MSKTYEEKSVLTENNGVINLQRTVVKMLTEYEINPQVKFALSIYFGFVFLNFIHATYHVGKNKLLDERSTSGYKYNPNKEWIAVSNECRKGTFWRFLESVIFPYTVFSNVVPTIVMKLNPYKENK
jgi:hypothetical protein